MNRRILRNGMLALVLSTAAMLLPAGETAAQSCTPACQWCFNFAYYSYEGCAAGCSDSSCYDFCYNQYIAPALVNCPYL